MPLQTQLSPDVLAHIFYQPQYQFGWTDDNQLIYTTPDNTSYQPFDPTNADPQYLKDFQWFQRNIAYNQPGGPLYDPGMDSTNIFGNIGALVPLATLALMGGAAGAEALGFGAGAGAAGAEAGAGATAGSTYAGLAGTAGELLPGEVSAAGAVGGGGGALAAGGGATVAGGTGLEALFGDAGYTATGQSLLAGSVVPGAEAGTGLFGTGLTASQLSTAAKALGAVSSLTGGVGGAGGGGGGGPSTTTSTSNVLDPQARALLDLIIQKQFPARFGGFTDVMNAFTERAAASPEALEGLVTPQLRQMGQALLQAQDQASRTLGPFGGAQIDRARGGALRQQPVLKAFTDPVLQSQQDLSSFLGNAGLINPQGRTSKSQTDYPPNIGQIGTALTGLFGLGKNVYNAF